MAWQPFIISANAAVPKVGADGNGCHTPLDFKPNYYIGQPGVLNWQFPARLGEVIPGKVLGVTSISYASKHIIYNPNKDPITGVAGLGFGDYSIYRSCYCVLKNLPTVTEEQPHLTFPQPIILSDPDFVFTGGFCNATHETINMIVIVAGRVADTIEELTP